MGHAAEPVRALEQQLVGAGVREPPLHVTEGDGAQSPARVCLDRGAVEHRLAQRPELGAHDRCDEGILKSKCRYTAAGDTEHARATARSDGAAMGCGASRSSLAAATSSARSCSPAPRAFGSRRVIRLLLDNSVYMCKPT